MTQNDWDSLLLYKQVYSCTEDLHPFHRHSGLGVKILTGFDQIVQELFEKPLKYH